MNVDSDLYTYSSKRDWYGGHFKTYEENPVEGEKLFRYEYDVPYCKIIKKTLVDEFDIHFEETTNQNDVRFSYMTGYYAKSIKVDKRAIYTVTYSPKSIMFTWNPDKIKTRLGVYCRKVVFLKEHHITNGIHCAESLLYKINKETPEIYEDCINIISKHGLDANHYRLYVKERRLKEEKKMARENRINSIKKILRPIKKLIS